MKKKLMQISFPFILLFCLGSAGFGQPVISSTIPSLNQNNVSKSGNINITFSESMDQATLTTANIKVVGSQSGLHAGSFSYNGGTFTSTFNPTTDFSVGEKVTVSVGTGVENASNTALDKSYSWSFTVKSGTATANLTQTNLQVGEEINSGPSDVNVSDVDHDGDADLVWTYKGYNKFMVSLNNGSGSFSSPVSYTGITAKQGFTVDLNNDGYPDYVGITQRDYGNPDSLHVYLNNGNGTFSSSGQYSVGADNYYGGFAVGDVNGDGYADLISTQVYNKKVAVLINNGDATFATAVTYNANSGPRGITVGDVNGDGHSDIVVTNDVSGTDSVTVLFNNGSGAFNTLVEYSLGGDKTPVGVTTADLNNDGKLDIATANAVGDISVLMNNGNGTYATAVIYSTGYGRIYIKTADLNGDGYLDLISGGGNVYRQLLNNGDGTFGTAVGGNIATASGNLDSGDLNGDGAIDVAYTDGGSWFAKLMMNTAVSVPEIITVSPYANELNILTNQAINITFSESMDQATLTTANIKVVGSQSGKIGGGIGYATEINTASFNVSPDYLPGEVITVTVTTEVKSASGVSLDKSYSWSFRVKSGTATANLTQTNLQVGEEINSGPSDVNVSDVDHDGDADLVWTYKGYNKFMVSLNNGSGSFSSPVSYTGIIAKQGFTVDLNNDGYPDYVGITQRDYGNPDSLHVYLNNGNGTFSSSGQYSVGADNYYGSFTVGDVDGDGYPDLISTQNYTNKIVVLKNNGNGTFASAVSYNSNNHPRGITTGDVNSDGFSDIVVVNDVSGTDSITVLFNNGSGAFNTLVEYSLGGDKTPVGVTVADLNNDGKLDIATANAVGDISVLMNSGNGTYTAAVIYSTGYGRIYIKTADLNGDGYLDLISGGGNVYRQLLNNGDGTFGTAVGGNIATASGNLDSGDLNGDGAIDVAYTDGGSWFAKLMMNSPTTVPVEMATFSAVAAENKISLKWSTVTESNNTGWDVEFRGTGNKELGTWKKVGFVAGKGTTTEKQNYSFTVSSLQSSVPRAEFRLKQIDADGNFSYSDILSVNLTPESYSLSQNYPNPFNPTTAIVYQLPVSGSVKLVVYDMLGREVMTLVNEEKLAGSYVAKFDGSKMTSGIYFYKISSGNFSQIRKMTLMK